MFELMHNSRCILYSATDRFIVIVVKVVGHYLYVVCSAVH